MQRNQQWAAGRMRNMLPVEFKQRRADGLARLLTRGVD
jgi:hypothetical protein